ncbi:putative serine/threonine protein kinase [Blattamonas nauphoetae]|uniref:Serine/threonine protein kinase n=1 Tax=Blattamonas nauphoetae TaxID=2049346 RepID=A0ABQ9YEK9_9EUKA|nr:putative serine/threonine protein kinase [Blattamonas nauphoetae]
MDEYIVQEQIGSGKNSTCYLGRRHKSIQYYCMKTIDKKMKDIVSAEVQIWHSLDHPNIVKFIDWFETTNHLWVVLELCAGGIFSRLLSQDKRLNETSIRAFSSDIRAALLFLHQSGIVYGDLHPSTILFDSAGTMKLCDFKFSYRVEQAHPEPPQPIMDTLLEFSQNRESNVNIDQSAYPDGAIPEIDFPSSLFGIDGQYIPAVDVQLSNDGIPLIELEIQEAPEIPDPPPLDNLIWNVSTDLVASPVFNGKDIQTINPPSFNPTKLAFTPFTAEDIAKPATSTSLETHMNEVVSNLKNAAQAVTEDNSADNSSRFLNILNYLANLTRSDEVSTVILRSKSGVYLLSLLKSPPLPQFAPAITFVFATLLRYAKRVGNSVASNGLAPTLALGVGAADEKQSRHAMAALGELLYYIAREKPVNKNKEPAPTDALYLSPRDASPILDPIDSKWQIDENIPKVVVEALKSTSIIKAHYAAKTIANLSILPNSALMQMFCTTECVDALLSLRRRADGALAQTTTIASYAIARFDPQVQTYLNQKTDFPGIVRCLTDNQYSLSHTLTSLNQFTSAIKSMHTPAIDALKEAAQDGTIETLLEKAQDPKKQVILSKLLLVGCAYNRMMSTDNRSFSEKDIITRQLLGAINSLEEMNEYGRLCFSVFSSSITSSFTSLFSSFAAFLQSPQELVSTKQITDTEIAQTVDDCETTLRSFDWFIKNSYHAFWVLNMETLYSLASLLQCVTFSTIHAVTITKNEEKLRFTYPDNLPTYQGFSPDEDNISGLLTEKQRTIMSNLAELISTRIIHNYSYVVNNLSVVSQSVVPLVFSFAGNDSNDIKVAAGLISQFASILDAVQHTTVELPCSDEELQHTVTELSSTFLSFFQPNIEFFSARDPSLFEAILQIAVVVSELDSGILTSLSVPELYSVLIPPSAKPRLQTVQCALLCKILESHETDKTDVPWQALTEWAGTELSQLEQITTASTEIPTLRVLTSLFSLLNTTSEEQNTTLFTDIRKHLILSTRFLNPLLQLLQTPFLSPHPQITRNCVLCAVVFHHTMKYYSITTRRLATHSFKQNTISLFIEIIQKYVSLCKVSTLEDPASTLTWLLKTVILMGHPFYSPDGPTDDCAFKLISSEERANLAKIMQNAIQIEMFTALAETIVSMLQREQSEDS